jgi:hypothetical protein
MSPGLTGAIKNTLYKKVVNPYKTGQALKSEMPKPPKPPTL